MAPLKIRARMVQGAHEGRTVILLREDGSSLGPFCGAPRWLCNGSCGLLIAVLDAKYIRDNAVACGPVLQSLESGEDRARSDLSKILMPDEREALLRLWWQ